MTISPQDRPATPWVAPPVECIWDLRAELGEGPVWSEVEQSLFFVDILGRRIHRFTPATGQTTSWIAPARVSFIVPVASGGFLCGLENGLRQFDPANGRFGPLHPIEPLLTDNRLNDGHVDPQGRLWFGSMHDPEEAATGSLYRLTGLADPLEPVLMDGGYTVSNGPAIDPVRRRLYHNDSARRTVYVFDLSSDGTLSNKRCFAETPGAYPDGLAVDTEGTLWVALFDGAGIQRFRPDGTPDGVVPIESAHVTKIAFGGDDLRTVYVTSSHKNLSPEQRAAYPRSGSLFRFRVDVPGLPQHLFRDVV